MSTVILRLKDAKIYQKDHLVLSKVSFELKSGDFIYLIGKTGTGKSSLLYQIMESVSTGSPLFGKLNVKRGKVLVIQVDETFINAKTKFKAMELKPDSNNVRFKWEWSPSQMPELEELVKSGEIFI